MSKIVLDTNVVVSALLTPCNKPAQIVSMVLLGRETICLSESIFAEYTGVLERPKFQKLDQEGIQAFLTRIKNVGNWVTPTVKIDIIEADPKDNKFLECAKEADADYLITGNKRHFPMKAFHGVKILTPTEFLISL